jgi:hypothetical protein
MVGNCHHTACKRKRRRRKNANEYDAESLPRMRERKPRPGEVCCRCQQGLDVRKNPSPGRSGEVFLLDIPFYRIRRRRGGGGRRLLSARSGLVSKVPKGEAPGPPIFSGLIQTPAPGPPAERTVSRLEDGFGPAIQPEENQISGTHPLLSLSHRRRFLFLNSQFSKGRLGATAVVATRL